jgi:hypothetical protein
MAAPAPREDGIFEGRDKNLENTSELEPQLTELNLAAWMGCYNRLLQEKNLDVKTPGAHPADYFRARRSFPVSKSKLVQLWSLLRLQHPTVVPSIIGKLITMAKDGINANITEHHCKELKKMIADKEWMPTDQVRFTDIPQKVWPARYIEPGHTEGADVEAPVIGLPVVEAPVVGTQEVEAPVVSESVLEAHDVETPVVGTQVVEALVVSASVIEAHDVEAPVGERSAVETLVVEVPEAPSVNVPVVGTHAFEALEVEAVVVGTHVVEGPQASSLTIAEQTLREMMDVALLRFPNASEESIRRLENELKASIKRLDGIVAREEILETMDEDVPGLNDGEEFSIQELGATGVDDGSFTGQVQGSTPMAGHGREDQRPIETSKEDTSCSVGNEFLADGHPADSSLVEESESRPKRQKIVKPRSNRLDDPAYSGRHRRPFSRGKRLRRLRIPRLEVDKALRTIEDDPVQWELL